MSKIPSAKQVLKWSAVALLLTGCAHYPVNTPLERYEPNGGYRLRQLAAADNSKRLLVILTFSGGGTRAAAFSYGVLEGLARTDIEWEGRRRRLLDEVDIISAVSGGSFTAAYYGLYGDRIFFDFEERFLRKNVQRGLIARLFSPANWARLPSPYFGRSDVAAKYYDKHLFHGATFGDLLAAHGPRITINATDLTGLRFGFDQPHFEWICSDLLSFPISRAVAASSAVPIVLSPITLRNYAGSCGYRPPAAYEKTLQTRDGSSREYHLMKRMEAYLDRQDKPYLHLVDGGLSDDLGLRAIMDNVILAGGAPQALEQRGLAGVRKVLFVVVNAQSPPEARWGKRERVPSIPATISATTRIALNQYNLETMSLLRTNLDRWVEEVLQARCDSGAPRTDLSTTAQSRSACEDLQVFLVEVGFTVLADERERSYLERLPGGLKLSDEAVDRLRAAAGQILRESETFQAFLRVSTSLSR